MSSSCNNLEATPNKTKKVGKKLGFSLKTQHGDRGQRVERLWRQSTPTNSREHIFCYDLPRREATWQIRGLGEEEEKELMTSWTKVVKSKRQQPSQYASYTEFFLYPLPYCSASSHKEKKALIYIYIFRPPLRFWQTFIHGRLLIILRWEFPDA